MQIIINQIKFPYDIGCRILKLKYENCPLPEIEDIWDDIIPASFKEISILENLEQRRVGIFCLGLERLVKEINPELVSKKTLKKETTWVNEKGEMITHKFNDTYELYKVSGDYFNKGIKNGWGKMEDAYYVKCKDTSTDREYMLWVDIRSVASTNGQNGWNFDVNKVNAIQAIAWTIQTNVEEGNIDKIVRQGDCILIKPNKKGKISTRTRHLTEKEYKSLLVAES
jgi:hypothetical protein